MNVRVYSRRRARVPAIALIVLLAGGCASDGDGGEPVPDGGGAIAFVAPEECAACHPRQYREWEGAMMHYGAVSPVFHALEAVGNQLTDGLFASDGEEALFCQGCHTPVSVQREEFPSFDEMAGRPSRDFLGEVGRRGLSCDFCHRVAHADLEESLLGDGIANAPFVLERESIKYGPFTQPNPNVIHESRHSEYLKSSEFCGGCHDVRPRFPDVVTGEPFQRLEDAFTEWKEGPYATANNPYGRVITCQDCHMSLYPYGEPGTYPVDRAAALASAPQRRVSTHYFTGVDVALIDFPGQDDDGLDEHGLPIGQSQRREDLLRAACTMEVDVPAVAAAGEILPIDVAISNSGAGHNVPTGFSQERQMWIELTVRDLAGETVYRSGYLIDRPHPETGETQADGSLHDEDLENLWGYIDPHSGEADMTRGSDHDQRPEANLGLVNFGNEFERVHEDGHEEEVFIPFIANHMNNSNSIPPLETASVRYDIPLPNDVSGPLSISVRLRFRPFPPRFLRMLAQARPDLVNEDVVDRNRIVDMIASEHTVPLR